MTNIFKTTTTLLQKFDIKPVTKRQTVRVRSPGIGEMDGEFVYGFGTRGIVCFPLRFSVSIHNTGIGIRIDSAIGSLTWELIKSIQLYLIREIPRPHVIYRGNFTENTQHRTLAIPVNISHYDDTIHHMIYQQT